MNCYSIKMTPFIDWFLGENLEKNPLPDNWDDILNEYMGLRENKGSRYMLDIIKDITFLKAKYQIIESACSQLLICFQHVLVSAADELKDILRQYNYRYKFDLSDEKSFSANIRAVLSANKKLITTWQRKEKDLEDYKKKHTGNEWSRKSFYVWAVTLGEHRQDRVDLDMVTVAEWCIMLNKYESYCEVVNAQQKGKQYGKHK